MPTYRSYTTTQGRNMAGARALWRATGMKDGDFSKPIIAVVNSFTQFVPGHVHLKDLGQLVAREIEASGGVAKEFNTIAVDDGIAMGHGGMLYSLPSRDLIADSVEYMVNAHCADAMVCISNCDKITPGMLMAAMRLNIPVVFVSGGPMEAGKVLKVVNGDKKIIKLDLIDAMIKAGDDSVSDADVAEIERSACPTCVKQPTMSWPRPRRSVGIRPRLFGSCSSKASRTASEIWSAILSGWPSVTDSDVNVWRRLTRASWAPARKIADPCLRTRHGSA